MHRIADLLLTLGFPRFVRPTELHTGSRRGYDTGVSLSADSLSPDALGAALGPQAVPPHRPNVNDV